MCQCMSVYLHVFICVSVYVLWAISVLCDTVGVHMCLSVLYRMCVSVSTYVSLYMYVL